MIACLLVNACTLMAQRISTKPLSIITTDGEIDDVDSYIRMLSYANEFNIEGLVYNSSKWQCQKAGTSPEKVVINTKGNQPQIKIPENTKSGDTIHIIVEGKDTGIPSLTRCQLVVLMIK